MCGRVPRTEGVLGTGLSVVKGGTSQACWDELVPLLEGRFSVVCLAELGSFGRWYPGPPTGSYAGGTLGLCVN